jgi:ATP-dependent Clp protease protease subunit
MHPLLKLFAANRSRNEDLRIVQGREGDDAEDSATIYVYDAIGGWDGVGAKEMVRAIAGISASTIHLRINSPGGDVFEARAIKTALEQHKARVVAYVDGVAASAASFLMLAADEIQIAAGAFVMIHNPWGFAIGGAREMRSTADLLDSVGAAIRNDYAARTGLDDAVLTQMMDAETWLTAEESVEKKFADSIMNKPAKASALARFDLSAYQHAPAALVAKQPNAFDDLAQSRERQTKRLQLYRV